MAGRGTASAAAALGWRPTLARHRPGLPCHLARLAGVGPGLARAAAPAAPAGRPARLGAGALERKGVHCFFSLGPQRESAKGSLAHRPPLFTSLLASRLCAWPPQGGRARPLSRTHGRKRTRTRPLYTSPMPPPRRASKGKAPAPGEPAPGEPAPGGSAASSGADLPEGHDPKRPVRVYADGAWVCNPVGLVVDLGPPCPGRGAGAGVDPRRPWSSPLRWPPLLPSSFAAPSRPTPPLSPPLQAFSTCFTLATPARWSRPRNCEF